MSTVMDIHADNACARRTRIVRFSEWIDTQSYAHPDDWPRLGLNDWLRTQPDAHWLLLDDHGQALARCSAWWSQAATHAGRTCALVGHFAAIDVEQGRQLLLHVAAWLGCCGMQSVIGPIDGSTWEPYRLVVASDGSPAFPSEPRHPSHWPLCFSAAGFAPSAHYGSAEWRMDAIDSDAVARLHARIERTPGIRLRPFDPACSDEELVHLHRISNRAFAKALLFRPISEAEFRARYATDLARLVPELLWFVERDGEPVGYVFCLPVAGAEHAEKTLVIKTLAVADYPGSDGLGLLLLRRAVEAGRALGCQRAISALMHERNGSFRMASHRAHGRVFRRYALFAKALE